MIQRIIARFENEYDIFVRNTARGIENSEEAYVTIKYVLTGILIGTVIIGLFGLIASAYSSILERRREIAITRTLGLYPSDINRMFLLESLILLLSSGGAGGIIGILLSYLLSQNMILFTESPSVFALPWDIIGIIVGLSLLVLIWGMNGLLRKLKRQNLIEIYRMTL
jgi:ABC-type antimicrobial peptide transport system permease subunit